MAKRTTEELAQQLADMKWGDSLSDLEMGRTRPGHWAGLSWPYGSSLGPLNWDRMTAGLNGVVESDQ